ncbi:hypothetical protein FIBSPDRAFT_871950 [Athelia psychrophila]|uniref:Uncharacterized protein n=1 Tax=Athelia psychrophila TaxID=1759441 RepID=A0A165ZXE3_9AGAM|nr:hypothetical protein FIBSPDRAFT_871950 [Fibularhizoctonia sp. CBS 109695]
MATRPRESLLNLFDPVLNGPSTPNKRDTVRSPSSDKENTEPCEPGQLTAFFNRTHAFKRASLEHVKPMARLVDVGDATVALDDEEDELEDGAEQGEFNGVENTPRREVSFTDDGETPMPRRVFVDIAPEATPVAPKWTYASSIVDIIQSAGPYEADRPHVFVLCAPEDLVDPTTTLSATELAPVIAAGELAPADVPLPTSPEPAEGLTHASPAHGAHGASTAHLIPSTTAALLTLELEQVPGEPVLAVEPPNDPLASSTAHLIPSATTTLLTQVPLSESINRPMSPAYAVPPIITTTSSRSRSQSPAKRTEAPPRHDHDRLASTDADAGMHSFNIQIDDQDSSFDLLNDKISFFHGAEVDMDSTLLDAEPDIGRDIPTDCRADDEDVGNASMANFDVRDEETRMKAFLKLSSGWEDAPVVPSGIPQTLAETNLKTPQSKLKPRNILSMSTSSEFTPMPAPRMAAFTKIPSSPLMASPRSAIPKMKSSPSTSITAMDLATPKQVPSSPLMATPRSAIPKMRNSLTTSITAMDLAMPTQIPSSPLMATPRSVIPKMRNSLTTSITAMDLAMPTQIPTSPLVASSGFAMLKMSRFPSITAVDFAAQINTKTPLQAGAFVAPRPIPALRIVKRANTNVPQPLASAPLTGSFSPMTSHRSMSASSAPSEPAPPQPALALLRKPTLNGIRRPEPGYGAMPPPATANANRPQIGPGPGLKERLQGKKAGASASAAVPSSAPAPPPAIKAHVKTHVKASASLSKLSRSQSMSTGLGLGLGLGVPPKQVGLPQPQAPKFGFGYSAGASAPVSRILATGASAPVSRLPPPAARKAIVRSGSGNLSLIPAASGASKIGVVQRG